MKFYISILMLIVGASTAEATCLDNAKVSKRISCEGKNTKFNMEVLSDSTGVCGTQSNNWSGDNMLGVPPRYSGNFIYILINQVERECDFEGYTSFSLNLKTGEGKVNSSSFSYDEYCEPDSGGGSTQEVSCQVTL